MSSLFSGLQGAISIEHKLNFIISLSSDYILRFQDDFEMMKDVDVSGDFVANEDTSENIEEKEVKEWSIRLLIFSTHCKFKHCKTCTCKLIELNTFNSSNILLLSYTRSNQCSITCNCQPFALKTDNVVYQGTWFGQNHL